MKQCNKVLKRHLYDLAVSFQYISLLRMFVISTSVSFVKSYLHHVFLEEGKVNGSLVIKRKTQKLFVIDSSITVNISFRYFMRWYSKYNALYLFCIITWVRYEKLAIKQDLLLFLEYDLNQMHL